MFGANFEIHLMPQQAILVRSPRQLNGSMEQPLETRTNVAPKDQMAWISEACGSLLAQHQCAGNLNITFSDLWARYDFIQLGEAELSDEDAMLLARAQFSRHYPDADSALWSLRLARQGKQMLVSGMNPSLLATVKQLAVASGKRLVRAEPLFAKVFDQYEKELARSDGWVLFDEPGMLIAAFVEKGLLFSLHCQRNDDSERGEATHLLLERQAALISRPAGVVRVFSYYGAPLALQYPWCTSQFNIVGPGSGSPLAPPKINQP